MSDDTPMRDFTLSDACGRDGWHSNHSLCAGRSGGGAPCDCPCHPQPIGRVLLDDERSRLTAGEVRERMEEYDRLASEVAILRAALVKIQRLIEGVPPDDWERGQDDDDPLWEALDAVDGITLAALGGVPR